MNKDVILDDTLHGRRRPRPPRIISVVLLLIGLALAVGGSRLVTLGGSLYYLIAGIALIGSAVGLWRGRSWGAYLYGVLTLGTVLWAVAEAGFNGWALAPRVLPFLVLGLFLLRPDTRRALLKRKPRPLRSLWLTWATVASLVAICIGVALRTPYPTLPFPTAASVSARVASDWQHWGGSAAGRRYAALDQINADNVSKLAVAWTYRTGVGGAFKATPLQIGDTLYVCLAGNRIAALDSATGTERWRFDPKLNDSKVGFTTTCRGVSYYEAPEPQLELLFLLDRTNGQPLAEVEERRVPQTDVPHEWTAKTQPFSVGMPACNREPLTEAQMWGITPIDQMLCRIQFRKLRYEGALTPPSIRGSVQFPGFAGGMNWGSVAVDEGSNVMIVNVLQFANHLQLIPRTAVTKETVLGMGGGHQLGTPYAAFTTPFMSPLFAPCQQPPYGEIAAVDLTSRTLLWRRPLGTANELGPLGFTFRLPIPMGVPYSGGTVVTKGGLVFMGGTMDRRFRALDVRTGEVLWSDVLPNNAQATPMSYASSQSRKQYVVIAVPAVNTPEDSHVAEPEAQRGASQAPPPASAGGWLIAYALPVADTR